MSNNHRPDRMESSLLAAALAVAGAPFLFDRLASLVGVSIHCAPTVMHSAPMLVVVVGAILMLAETRGSGAGANAKGGQREL